MKCTVLKPLIIVSLLLAGEYAMSQEKCALSVKASAELVSSYIWRGIPSYSLLNEQAVLSPNLQPSLGFEIGGFEVGAWGSTDFTGSFSELDLYAAYSIKGITATITDYYWDPDFLSKPYFHYKNETTSHLIEGMLTYDFEKFPLSISVATMLYGADKKYQDVEEDAKTTNNYSTYIELGYTFKVKESSFDALVGMTTADGLYGDGYGNVTGFGVVNLGLKGYKKIKLSENYETTLSSSFIVNPQQDKAFLVFGISF